MLVSTNFHLLVSSNNAIFHSLEGMNDGTNLRFDDSFRPSLFVAEKAKPRVAIAPRVRKTLETGIILVALANSIVTGIEGN